MTYFKNFGVLVVRLQICNWSFFFIRMFLKFVIFCLNAINHKKTNEIFCNLKNKFLKSCLDKN